MLSSHSFSETELKQLAGQVKAWGQALGFQQVGITGVKLEQDEAWLLNWLDKGYHGEMEYMQRHGTTRSRPDELVPGTIRVISARDMSRKERKIYAQEDSKV